METGHSEPRRWTSSDGSKSIEIDVFMPSSISEQHVVTADPIEEASVERQLQSLKGQPILQPMAAVLLRSEGMASSRIEGEVASTRRVYEAEYAPLNVADTQAQRIVNSIHVMGDVISTAENGVTPDDFDRWHSRLFQGVPAMFETGRVRTRQNWIGTRTDTPAGADFIPPPPDAVAEAMQDLARFVNRVDVAPLTQAAVAHAHFETIHPYPDGNGRIGRALVYRSWAYRGISTGLNPPISRIIVENREAYVDGLSAYREGDVERWLRFFLDVVESAVSYTHSLASRLTELTSKWQEKLTGTHQDALARRLVEDLSATPILSVSDVADRYQVTERGARSALEDLVEREVLTFRPLRKAKRGRLAKVYQATELFTLLDLHPRDLA